MAFSKETFGTLENGAVITKYTLTNKHGLKASFTDLGGIWLEMWVPDKHADSEQETAALVRHHQCTSQF